MNYVDLHIHSDFSDGLLSPEEIFNEIINNSLPGFALTDHDTFDGVESILKRLEDLKDKNLLFIAGAEFSSYAELIGEVHIIGYFSAGAYINMKNYVREFQQERLNRAKKIINCLKENGINLSEEILYKNKPIGRLNIARELVKMGFFKDISEAFEKMLKQGAPCYFKKKEVSPEEIIKIIVENGGRAVLAHPTFLGYIPKWDFLDEWIKLGLWGIECYHPKVNYELCALIKKNLNGKLVFTGGSDFHGEENGPKIGDFGLLPENVLEIFGDFVIK